MDAIGDGSKLSLSAKRWAPASRFSARTIYNDLFFSERAFALVSLDALAFPGAHNRLQTPRALRKNYHGYAPAVVYCDTGAVMLQHLKYRRELAFVALPDRFHERYVIHFGGLTDGPESIRYRCVEKAADRRPSHRRLRECYGITFGESMPGGKNKALSTQARSNQSKRSSRRSHLSAKTWSFLYARRPAWWMDSVNRRRLRQTPIQRVFENIFLHNRFQDPTNAMEDQDSISGPGSSLGNTEAIRKQLPDLFKNFEVSSLLDVPCGDFNWMRLVDLNGVEYIGGDIVPELISRNAERYEKNQVRFMQIDLTHDDLPNVDLILVRDCFIHLANRDIVKALRNIQRSGIKFLLATTYPEHHKNIDIVTGQSRPVNLDRPPFNFPKPIKLIREGLSNSEYTDKSLGLWKVSEIVV